MRKQIHFIRKIDLLWKMDFIIVLSFLPSKTSAVRGRRKKPALYSARWLNAKGLAHWIELIVCNTPVYQHD